MRNGPRRGEVQYGYGSREGYQGNGQYSSQDSLPDSPYSSQSLDSHASQGGPGKIYIPVVHINLTVLENLMPRMPSDFCLLSKFCHKVKSSTFGKIDEHLCLEFCLKFRRSFRDSFLI